MALITLLETNVVLYLLGGCVAGPLPAGLFSTRRVKRKYRSFLAEVTVVGATREVKERAIELRRRHELKLPDAIIGPTALAIDAELLSNGRTLRRIPQLRLRSVALKAGT